jgi:RimJ/RimL family protein N-acetyltransferase
VTGQPVGILVDMAPAQLPGIVTLTGRHGQVQRLDPRRHDASLWEALYGHDQLWTYMLYGPFADHAAFSEWLASRAELSDPYYYVIVNKSGRALGLTTLMSIRPEMRVVEVGNILLSPTLQDTTLATEAQYLLARYVFETLKFRRYEWKCDACEWLSKSA